MAAVEESYVSQKRGNQKFCGLKIVMKRLEESEKLPLS